MSDLVLSLRQFQRVLCCVLFVSLIGFAYGQDKAGLEGELEAIQSQLTQLGDEDESQRRVWLNKLAVSAQTQLRLIGQIEELTTELNEQPETIRQVSDDIAQAKQAEDSLLYSFDANLGQKIVTVSAKVLEFEQQQALLETQLRQAEQRQTAIQDQLAVQRDRLVDVTTQTQIKASTDPVLEQQLFDYQLSEQSLTVQTLELEALVLPGRAELATLELSLVNLLLVRWQSALDALSALEKSRQRLSFETETREIATRANSVLDASSELASITRGDVSLAQRNLTLIDVQRQLLSDVEVIQNDRTQLKKRLETLSGVFRSILQQLSYNASPMSSNQRDFIFGAREVQDIALTLDRINSLRIENALVDDAGLPSNIESAGAEAVSDVELVADYEWLMSQIVASRKQAIQGLSDVLNYQRQINRQVENNWQQIYEQLLKNPISEPVSLTWLQDVFKGSVFVVQYSYERLSFTLFKPTFLTLVGALFLLCWAALLFRLNRYIRGHEAVWAEAIGNVVKDNVLLSVKAFVLPFIITSFIPCVILLLANAVDEAQPSGAVVQEMLVISALALWAGWSMRRLCASPWGVCVAHFDVDPRLASLISRRIGVLLSAGLLLVLYQVWAWEIDSESVRSGPFRLAMLLLVGALAGFWISFWKVREPLERLLAPQWWAKPGLWLLCLVGFNLSMAVLVLFGYTLTVSVLTYLVFKSVLVFVCVFFAYKLGLRGLLVAQRRLEFEQAKAKRAERLAARENPDEETPLETNYINMQSVSAQSQTLLKTVTFLAFVSLMYLALGEYLPFINSLDSLEVWESLNANGEVIATITLKSILVGGVILGLSFLAAYNLPGLLELTVLSRLDLSPGTGYALTSLIKYSLIVFGLVSAFSHFGLEWGKLQWLVAALGVGLGFGLQEIVANFVSGLIILFEKPMRIGDTVTIDGLTGVVTRIQIRATTIVDWDRKEVIIPNKSFITQQLINWSLTDSITRVVIPVGVAYGSDTELARQVLLDVAGENPKVLAEPKPDAFFLGFGASTLDFELRLHVSAMSDRLEVTHQINTMIDAKFKKAGLEIAFNQLDVHVRYPNTEKPT